MQNKFLTILFTTTLATTAHAQDCVDPDVSKIAKGHKIMLCAGDIVEGTFTEKPNCTVDGEKDCVATNVVRAVNKNTVKTGDIMIGKSVAGITGTNKLHKCRNGANAALFNAASPPPNTGATAGDALQGWDTIDDYNNGTGFPSALAITDVYGPDYYCNGTHLVDVSNTAAHLKPSGQAINCGTSGTGTCTNADARPFTTIIHDPWMNIYMTNSLIASGGTATQGADWAEAVSACHNLDSGDGPNKWRLPTQKEQVLMYVGGIYAMNSLLFSSQLHDYYSNSSTRGDLLTEIWAMRLSTGEMPGHAKTANLAIMCIR